MKGLVFAGALCLVAGSALAGDEPVLERLVWESYPTIEALETNAPHRTDDDFEGQIDLICRIRNSAGQVKCLVSGMDPIDTSWAESIRKSLDASARVDMRRTEGARPGRLVHAIVRIVLE